MFCSFVYADFSKIDMSVYTKPNVAILSYVSPELKGDLIIYSDSPITLFTANLPDAIYRAEGFLGGYDNITRFPDGKITIRKGSILPSGTNLMPVSYSISCYRGSLTLDSSPVFETDDSDYATTKKALYKPELDLKKFTWTPPSIDVSDIASGGKSKLDWSYENEFENSYVTIEAKGILNRSYYVEVGNIAQIGGNPMPVFFYYLNHARRYKCSLKSHEYTTDIRDSAVVEYGLKKAFNYVPEEFYITRFLQDGDNLYRSKVVRIKIDDRNSIAVGTTVSGTDDSNSSDFKPDTSDPNFGGGQDNIGGVDTTFPGGHVGDDLNKDYVGSYTDYMHNLKDSVGALPDMFSQLFSFLPKDVLFLISAGFSLVIVLRIVGR